MVTACESCGMPLATAADHALGETENPYCRYCTDAEGHLQSATERIERMTQWSMRQSGADYETARKQALAYMRTMPAWKDVQV